MKQIRVEEDGIPILMDMLENWDELVKRKKSGGKFSLSGEEVMRRNSQQ